MDAKPTLRLSIGSPAWAGIDLSTSSRAGVTTRFPRVGGDRPAAGENIGDLYEVPPRGRG